MSTFFKILIAWVVVFFVATVIWLMLWSREGNAHEAIPTAAQPKGWTYPTNCCSGYDCRVINSSSKVKILETARGFVIVKPNKTEELIPYNDTKVRNSPDGDFHWCSAAGRDDTNTICLFAPPRGI